MIVPASQYYISRRKDFISEVGWFSLRTPPPTHHRVLRLTTRGPVEITNNWNSWLSKGVDHQRLVDDIRSMIRTGYRSLLNIRKPHTPPPVCLFFYLSYQSLSFFVMFPTFWPLTFLLTISYVTSPIRKVLSKRCLHCTPISRVHHCTNPYQFLLLISWYRLQ